MNLLACALFCLTAGSLPAASLYAAEAPAGAREAAASVTITAASWTPEGACIKFAVAPDGQIDQLQLLREEASAQAVPSAASPWLGSLLAGAAVLPLLVARRRRRRRPVLLGLLLVATGTALAARSAVILDPAARHYIDPSASRTQSYRFGVVADGVFSGWAFLPAEPLEPTPPAPSPEPSPTAPPADGATPQATPTVQPTEPLPTATPVGPVDLHVRRVILQQAVPRLLGEPGPGAAAPPMIARRDTMVRVVVGHAAPSGSVAGVRARLRGFRGETELQPALEAGPLQALATADEQDLAQTLNFRLPLEWVEPDLRLVVELDPDDAIAEPDETNNRFPAEGLSDPGLIEAPALRVVFVPIHYVSGSLDTLPSLEDLEALSEPLWATFPIHTLEMSVHEPLLWTQPVKSDGTGWSELLYALAGLWLAEGAPADVHYYGLVDPGFSSGVAGLGLVPFGPSSPAPVAIGLAHRTQAGSIAAHELGHNHGRLHVDCGGAGSVDPEYPYPKGLLGVTGWDPQANVLLEADVYRDLMSYCSPKWVSDYQLEALHTFRIQVAQLQPSIQALPASESGALEVVGLLQGGRVRSLRLLRAAQSKTRPQRTGGAWSLQARGAGRTVHVSFEPVPVDHLPDTFVFSAQLPYPGALDELRVLQNGRSRLVRKAEPRLRQAAPLSLGGLRLERGGQRLRWSESGRRGTPLQRLVRLSRDGGRTFEVLSMDAPAGSFELPAGLERPARRLLRGARGSEALEASGRSTEPLLVEVQLSDGLGVALQRLVLGD